MSPEQTSEVRFTQPGPDSGDKTNLEEQGRWLRFAESAEALKGRGELSDAVGLADLALQNAEDRVDVDAGIVSPQAK